MDPDLATSRGYEPLLQWVATYKDGQSISGHDHNSEVVDRKKLRSIALVNKDGAPVITQHFKPGQRVIYRARTIMRTGMGVMDRVHILGWWDQHSEHVAFVFESGQIEMGHFIDPETETDKPWFYPISENPADLVPVEP
jgi:hypothetical protein